MVLFVVHEAYRRFLSPVDIDTAVTLLLATGGLGINLAAVYVLRGEGMSLNERGAFYHLLGDAGASVAVIVSTLVVGITGVRVVDPVTAVLVAGLIVWSALRLLRESGAIFFQRSPVDVAAVRAAIESLDGVESVEDVHTWSLTGRITVASVYVVNSATTIDERDALVGRIHELLDAEFDVAHATVEAVSQHHEHSLG